MSADNPILQVLETRKKQKLQVEVIKLNPAEALKQHQDEAKARRAAEEEAEFKSYCAECAYAMEKSPDKFTMQERDLTTPAFMRFQSYVEELGYHVTAFKDKSYTDDSGYGQDFHTVARYLIEFSKQ